jgi:hypothetical protein
MSTLLITNAALMCILSDEMEMDGWKSVDGGKNCQRKKKSKQRVHAKFNMELVVTVDLVMAYLVYVEYCQYYCLSVQSAIMSANLEEIEEQRASRRLLWRASGRLSEPKGFA